MPIYLNDVNSNCSRYQGFIQVIIFSTNNLCLQSYITARLSMLPMGEGSLLSIRLRRKLFAAL